MMSVNKEPIRNHILHLIWALSPVSHLIIGIVIQASKMTELVMHIEVHPASYASYHLPQVPSIFTLHGSNCLSTNECSWRPYHLSDVGAIDNRILNETKYAGDQHPSSYFSDALRICLSQILIPGRQVMTLSSPFSIPGKSLLTADSKPVFLRYLRRNQGARIKAIEEPYSILSGAPTPRTAR